MERRVTTDMVYWDMVSTFSYIAVVSDIVLLCTQGRVLSFAILVGILLLFLRAVTIVIQRRLPAKNITLPNLNILLNVFAIAIMTFNT